MSIAFNGSNQYLKFSGSQIASLTAASEQTMTGWFKTATTTSNYGLLFHVNNADETSLYSGVEAWTSGDFRPWFNGSRGDAWGTRAANTWVYVAWYNDGSGNVGGATAQTGLTSGASFAVHPGASSGASATLVNFQVGRLGTNGAYLSGEACCVRIFSAKLTTTQLYSEAISATPVLGSCVANWRMATNADLTDTVGSKVFTAFNTPSTGSTEPTDIAGASTTRGMPFGNRSTAFNGGRIFTGPIY
jgi:hypothetical protein